MVRPLTPVKNQMLGPRIPFTFSIGDLVEIAKGPFTGEACTVVSFVGHIEVVHRGEIKKLSFDEFKILLLDWEQVWDDCK